MKTFVGVVLGLCVSALLLLAVIWNRISIKETPTCVSYSFSLNGAKLTAFEAESKAMLTEMRVPLRSVQGHQFLWQGSQTSVLLSAHGDSPSTAFVCTNEKKSTDWQRVASALESVISKNGATMTAYIQLDSSVYHCNPHCYKDVSVPVDFSILNAGSTHDPLKD